MPNAKELLQSYLDNVRDPAAAAALFADDGIIEIPTFGAEAQGPAGVVELLNGLLKLVPDFRFQDIVFWIETPDRVFAEYKSDGTTATTGKRYQQTYAGLLIAENGKIKRLREAMDTLLAYRVSQPD